MLVSGITSGGILGGSPKSWIPPHPWWRESAMSTTPGVTTSIFGESLERGFKTLCWRDSHGSRSRFSCQQPGFETASTRFRYEGPVDKKSAKTRSNRATATTSSCEEGVTRRRTGERCRPKPAWPERGG